MENSVNNPQPAPFPVSPLEYQHPSDNRRPGILKAIGIISIVLASIGALMSASSLITTAGVLLMSRMNFPTAVPTTAPTTSTSSSTVSYSYSVTAGTSTTSYRSTTRRQPFPFSMSTSMMATTFITAGIGLLLAMLLFVAGVKTLRDSPNSARLHWIYIWIKIPLVLIGAVSTWFWYSSLFSNMNTLTPGAPGLPPNLAAIMAASSAAVAAGFSLIYPILLMVALSNRNVKAYLAAL